MQADEMMLLTDRSKQTNGNAQVILERSQQRIRDIAELMGGTSQFTTSMNMFNANGGMMPEDDDDEFASDRKPKQQQEGHQGRGDGDHMRGFDLPQAFSSA